MVANKEKLRSYAQHYIDWEATEAENPLAEESEDSYTEEGNEAKGEDAA